MDAQNITIPDGQMALVDAVLAVAAKPVIVVMLTAVPLDLTPLLSNPKVGAIMHAGQPSAQGQGIGDVIFGKKVPAGRMIQTVYPAEYAAQISIFDFNMRPGPSLFPRPDCTAKTGCPLGTNPGRTYRFYTGKAVVPFGFGLSYTTFSYKVTGAPATVSLSPHLPRLLARAKQGFVSVADADAAGPATSFKISVTNTGTRDADDVVLGFLTPPGAGTNGVAKKVLFGFERVFVPAGATVDVILYPEFTDLAHVRPDGVRVANEGTFKATFGVEESAHLGMGFAEHTFAAHL